VRRAYDELLNEGSVPRTRATDGDALCSQGNPEVPAGACDIARPLTGLL